MTDETLPMASDDCTCSGCAEGEDFCYCPVGEALDLLNRKHALPIIALVGNHGRLRFGEIEDHLPGVSPKTLSDRLKELTAAGILDRKEREGFPPHVAYALTDRGRNAREAVKPLMTWAARGQVDVSLG